ncbi:MAG: M1 family metallopeptidase [Deltaproteobacteria bacterium]|nr:M1 family metallopeptidase [Deltaproteobacteria bacterium]
MNDVNPIQYTIHLEPDLNTFRFKGSTSILLEAVDPIREIGLNALELAISSCEVKKNNQYVECAFSVDSDKEEVHVSLPERMIGEIELRFDYFGEINNKMVGFYRSRYVADGKEKYIAVTQFEESDARRAFPCFDHPIKKAFFDVEMVIDKDLDAISNCAIIEEKPLNSGKKLVKFQRTPKMSTYLLFFGVGEFEVREAPGGDVRLRLAAMPGMTKYGQFGLEFGKKSLEFAEAYYGITYPLSKLDLIAVPDFAFGAMENWGAITFRENLLLHYLGITSKAGEQRICEVIAHEIAHMWFGNLVSPSDWAYLWLNESFATYFGYGIVAHYHPEWDIWEQFLSGQTNSSLDRDSFRETFPIEIPGGEHVVINTSTAPIIYSKGGSVLRQVEGYMGEDDFREGVRHYLKKHEFGCASSHHLWNAFEEVSSKPVSKMMESWVEQPGFPLVEVRRKGRELSLNQKRFTYLENTSDQTWLIPLGVKVFYGNGQTKTTSILFEDKDLKIDVGEDVVAYKVNHRQTGFYRVKYSKEEDLQALGVRAANKELSSEDRWGLQNDLYALVRTGEAALDDYLGFLAYYSTEDAFLSLTSIAGHLFHAFLIMGGKWKKKIVSVGKSFLEGILSKVGYDPVPNETHTLSILRDQILWHLILYGSERATEFCSGQFALLMRGKEIHPDIIASVMKAGALQGDQGVLGWIKRRLETSESEHERMNLLAALGSFGDRGLTEKALAYTLEKVSARNKFVPITYMAANPHAIPFMWEWYVSHLEELEKLHPIHYERIIACIVPVCAIECEQEVKSFYLDYISEKKVAVDVIRLSLERLEVNCRMRKREDGQAERKKKRVKGRRARVRE